MYHHMTCYSLQNYHHYRQLHHQESQGRLFQVASVLSHHRHANDLSLANQVCLVGQDAILQMYPNHDPTSLHLDFCGHDLVSNHLQAQQVSSEAQPNHMDLSNIKGFHPHKHRY